jgi:hypothetical protein
MADERQPANDGRTDGGLDHAHLGGDTPAGNRAVNLRMWSAGLVFLICAALTLYATVQGPRWLSVVAAIAAIGAAVAFIWNSQRERRGEPG